jgi:hypothetical protein
MRAERSSFGDPRPRRAKGYWLGIASSAFIGGMAAAAVAVACLSAGTPAGSSASRSPATVGSAHAKGSEHSATANSPRLASLDPDLLRGAPSVSGAGQAQGFVRATGRTAFDDRFNSSFSAQFLPFDEDGEPAARSLQRPDDLARPETPKRPNPRVAMLAPATNAVPPAPGGAAKSKPAYPVDMRGDAILESLGGRTAIYDISARVVYLPNGETLETHSGFGEHMDDPRSVALKKLGVTPPNVYELSMRERLFHGVRAVRLNPVDPERMFGRAGMLAHSYLLGPNGQSNGCLSIRDYPRFLNAFLNGEIDRLVVVERLTDPPSTTTAMGWLSQRVKALFRSS